MAPQRLHGRRSWSGLRSRPCGEGWHEHLRCGSAVADRGMRANGIVVAPPALDDDLGLAQGVEDLAVEQLVTQARVEALDEPVLPRAAGGDVGGLCADGGDPLLHRLGNELRAVVRTDMPGNAAQDEQTRQHIDDVDRFEPARHASLVSPPMFLTASSTFWPPSRTPSTTSSTIEVAFRSSRTRTTVPSRITRTIAPRRASGHSRRPNRL